MPIVTLIVDTNTRAVIIAERAQADGATRRLFQIHALADELQCRHTGLDPLRKHGSLRRRWRLSNIYVESDLTSPMGKQATDVQLLLDADVAAAVELTGIQIPTLDKSQGQHQGWTREYCVWNWQAFRRCHCKTSIA